MRKIFTLLVVGLILNTSTIIAQETVKVKKSDFYFTDQNFDMAWKAYKKGNRLYKQNLKGSYQMAIEDLEIAYQYNPDYAPLNYQLGIASIFVSDFKSAQKYIEDAFMLDANISSDIHFWLARAYHLNSKFSDAILEYEIHRGLIKNNSQKKQQVAINRYIKECENGIALSDIGLHVIIDNLGENVNSKYPDYSPVFTPYDSIVYFTSRRPNTTGESRNSNISNEYYEDIYYTSALNGVWQTPAQMPKPINSRWNDASVAINPSGNGILIYRGRESSGDILISEKKIKGNGEEKWTKPKEVIKKVNKKKYRETTLTFNNDSTIVFFISDRKGGKGGSDIWVTKKRGNSNSGWTKPENLSDNINSFFDEESVFLANNDSVLYFASNGRNTIGGFDLFKSHLLPDGRWSEAVNLGTPINTPNDDMFLYLNPNMRTGYFTSNGQEDSYGDFDIFSFFFYSPKDIISENDDDLIAYIKEPVNELIMDAPIVIKTMRLTVVKGLVSEYETDKPLYANVEIIDNATQEVVQSFMTNASSGSYTVMLPSGKDYGMSVSADGYMFHSENFKIPSATGFQEVTKDIHLLPVNPGAKIVLRNVFFDSGKETLRPESYPELTRLSEAFKLYPNLVVEISGHTDDVGSASYNQGLSQRRAQSVVDYLVSIGVPITHLVAKGYGESQPMASNATQLIIQFIHIQKTLNISVWSFLIPFLHI